MALSKITTKGILDGTIATADLADNAVNSAKIGADVIVADDVANNRAPDWYLNSVGIST